jgi:hypothetical protein
MPLGYPTGLPGFGAQFTSVFAKGGGTRADAVQLTSYVNRVVPDGNPNNAVILPLGSPGTILWVICDTVPGTINNQPITIWTTVPDRIFVATAGGGGILGAVDHVSLAVGDVAIFVCIRPETIQQGSRSIAVGARWRFIHLMEYDPATAMEASTDSTDFY